MAPYQTIKDWPEEDRPREKLLANGAAIAQRNRIARDHLRNGNASTGESAIDHARLLLSQFGGLKGIDDASVERNLSRSKGSARQRSRRSRLAWRSARRMGSQKWQTGQPLQSSEDVYHHFRESLGREKRELFYVVLLNNKNRKIRRSQNLRGIADSLARPPREVYNPVIRESAAGGDLRPQPSERRSGAEPEDIDITKRLQRSRRCHGRARARPRRDRSRPLLQLQRQRHALMPAESSRVGRSISSLRHREFASFADFDTFRSLSLTSSQPRLS